MAKRTFSTLSADFLHCRTVGHQWDERVLPWGRKVTYIGGKAISFRCDVCTTERREVWSEATGEMIYRTYNYPAGYAFTRNMVPAEMTTRQAMRAEYLARRKYAKRVGRKVS